jgi:exonuclease III
MKIISVNIEVNKHYDTILNLIEREKPDVICMQELLEKDVELFKQKLGMDAVFRKSKDIEPHHTYRTELIGATEGVAIFSKKILKSETFLYVQGSKKVLEQFEEYSIHVDRGLLWAEIEHERSVYKIATIHLPVTYLGDATPFQLVCIDIILRKLESLGEFALLGDTNAPRGKEAFARLARSYKDNIPPKYTTSLDQELHRVKGLQHMVDGFFTTPGYRVENVKLVSGVSDHMAVVGDIN